MSSLCVSEEALAQFHFFQLHYEARATDFSYARLLGVF